MNYLNLKLEKYQKYLISEANFGTIRYGDLIAISAITNALRKQYKDNKFFLFAPARVKDLIDCVQLNFDGIFNINYKIKERNLLTLPIKCNCWGLYNYLYKNFEITPIIKVEHILKNPNILNKFNTLVKRINYFKEKYNSKVILFIPLFSTPQNLYNHDRFFSLDFCINLINKILKEFYMNYFIILCGHNKNYFFNKLRKSINIKPPNLEIILTNNMMETIYLMTICDYYIGGDTGTSHIISNLKKGANNLIFIYGKESKRRHSEIEKNIENIITIKKDNYNDYSPKPIKEKNILYLDRGFDEITIKNVINFLI